MRRVSPRFMTQQEFADLIAVNVQTVRRKAGTPGLAHAKLELGRNSFSSIERMSKNSYGRPSNELLASVPANPCGG
jgi:hypothetical protein